MNFNRAAPGLVSIALLPCLAGCALEFEGEHEDRATSREGGGEGDEVEIKLTDAPAAVQAGAIRLAGSGTNISRVSREEDDEGVTTYEVEFDDSGTACAAVFSVNGETMETERVVAEAALPSAALAALRAEYPGAALTEPELVTRTFYEVEIVTEGGRHAVRVNAAGSIEDDDDGGTQGTEGGGRDEDDRREEAEEADGTGGAVGGDGWRDAFGVNKADLSPTGAGAFFVLEPGRRMTYADGDELLIVTVLDETRVVDGVLTRVVEERESKGGALVEVSRNFFAIEPRSGDTYYFGEDVDIYEGGKVVRHEGEWLSGEAGARFGLFISGAPRVGDRFYQEIAPGKAMDRFEVVSDSERIETKAGTFGHVVKTEETSPLESGRGSKWFAPGVGMIRDDDLVLTKVEPAAAR